MKYSKTLLNVMIEGCEQSINGLTNEKEKLHMLIISNNKLIQEKELELIDYKNTLSKLGE